MGLTMRPHTVTVWPGEEDTDAGGTVLPAAFSGVGTDVACSVQPISGRAAYEAYGIEVERAFEIFVDEADGPSLPIGARVLWARAGLYMRVRASMPWLNTDLAHYQILASVEALP